MRQLSLLPSNCTTAPSPPNRWCQVKLTFDGKQSTFSVDGKGWGSIPGSPFKATLNKPLTLSFGPFRGMVDELQVRLIK